MKRTIESYNEQVFKWKHRKDWEANVDDFVVYDDMKISWSSALKQKLQGGQIAEFAETKIRQSFYRPFTKSNLFFDRVMNQRVFVLPSIFPTPETEAENRVIWLKVGATWPTFALMIDKIPDTLPSSGSQCFPFYTYDEDGTNRRENITDWALERLRGALPRRVHRQMGHLSLRLRAPASPRLSGAVSGEPQT